MKCSRMVYGWEVMKCKACGVGFYGWMEGDCFGLINTYIVTYPL